MTQAPVKPKRTPRVASPRTVASKPQGEAAAAIVAKPVASAPVADEPVVATTPATTDENAAPVPAPTAEDTTMNDAIKTMTDKAQADAKVAFEKASEGAKTAMEKGKVAFADMNEFTKGNVEAMVESTRIAFQGFEAMAQQRAAFAKQSFDATAAHVKSLVELRSPTDFFKAQGDYVRTSVDALVAETSRSTEAALKLAGEIAQPIQNRFALAAEKVKAAA